MVVKNKCRCGLKVSCEKKYCSTTLKIEEVLDKSAVDKTDNLSLTDFSADK